MKHLVNHLKAWGDNESLNKLKKSERSIDVQKAEVENFLKDIALRYERSPNQSTIKLWASDIVDAGFDENTAKIALKSIPYKFEKMPSLSQIMALLNPYLPQISFSESELDKYTRLCFPHVKAKFLSMFTQDQLNDMIKLYEKHVFPDLRMFHVEHKEMCVLLDWLRSHFGDGKKLLNQGLRSNTESEANNKDYFLNQLKSYAKTNNL
jgi:hypothetical protein